jgi:peptidoglycan/LPS O-acetylase OafA/YrhL
MRLPQSISSNIKKVLVWLIYALYAAVLLLPYSEVAIAVDNDNDPHWRNAYLWEDFFLIVFYLILFGIWCLHCFLKKEPLKKIMGLLLLGIWLLYIMAITPGLGGQDWGPHLGFLISLFIPVALGLHLYERYRRVTLS